MIRLDMSAQKHTIPRRDGGRPGRFTAALLVAAAIVAGGCTTTVETSDGRPMPPKPRSSPPVPADAPVNALAMIYGRKPADSNNNGYPDLIPVEVYLFSQPYPRSIHRPGSFEFALYPLGQPITAEAVPMARWQLDEEAVTAAQLLSPVFGLGYGFRLRLLDCADDELPLMFATLVCRFAPADGAEMVSSDSQHMVQLGLGEP